jgi:alcohol dehydrogenase (cytochrome c)
VKWHDVGPTALSAYIQARMPPAAPGSIDAETAADLTALVLQANGFAAGPVAFAPAVGGPRPTLPEPKHDAPYEAMMARHRTRLQNMRPVSDDMLRDPPSADWLLWRGSYAGLGYSRLGQINRQNASRLTVAWARSIPTGGNEFAPLVHDGVIFVKSASHVLALDGASGDLLWEYVRQYPEWMQGGTTEIVKNIAIYQDSLYVPFLDGHVVALDSKTGHVVWDRVLVGPKEESSRLAGGVNPSDAQHYLMVADGGPMVADGEILIGVAGCANQYKGGCFIAGLDARTGAEDWRFHTVARPGEPGGDSWNGAPVEQRFGASVWFSGSYDPKLHLAYFGTGNTYKISTLLTPQQRKGDSNDALYTDSTLAIDPKTGRLAWYYQHFNADVWDLDWAFERMLVTLPVGGRPKDLVVTGGKAAVFDALDRENGRYQFSVDLGLQNIFAAIDPKTGKKTIDRSFMPLTDLTFPKSPCPYARDEPSTAFDPDTSVLYVPVTDASCPDPRGTFDGRYGEVVAVDMISRKPLWTQKHRDPEVSSLLVTAGGVVFDGTADRRFRAASADTGRVLWETRLDNVPKSSPVTYSVDGRQYVAVLAGGALAPNLLNRMPEGEDVTTNAETLWVLAVPETGDAHGGRPPGAVGADIPSNH